MKPTKTSVPYWQLKREDFIVVKFHNKYFIKLKDKNIYFNPNGMHSHTTDLPGAALNSGFGFESPEKVREAWTEHEKLLETIVGPL